MAPEPVVNPGLVQFSVGPWVGAGIRCHARMPDPVTPGNTLLAITCRSGNPFTNIPTQHVVSDEAGGRWRQAGEGVVGGYADVSLDNNRGLDVWLAERHPGGQPMVTGELSAFPVSSINGMRMALFEYPGAGGFELVESVGFGRAVEPAVTVKTTQVCSPHVRLVSVLVSNKPLLAAPPGWNLRVADPFQGFYIADLNDSGPLSAHQQATWSIAGASSGYAAILALKPSGCVADGAPRCEQMRYYAPGLGIGLPLRSTSTCPSLAVPPDAGSTVLANIVPNDDATVTAVVDQFGQHWTLLAEMGNDTIGRIQGTLWGRTGWPGGPVEATAALSKSVAGGLAAWILLEVAGLPDITVTATAHDLMFPTTRSPSTNFTPPAGSYCLLYGNGESGYWDGLDPGVGWRSRLRDSNGSAALLEAIGSGAVMEAGFAYNNAQRGSLYAVALGGS